MVSIVFRLTMKKYRIVCKKCDNRWIYKGKNYRTACYKCKSMVRTGIKISSKKKIAKNNAKIAEKRRLSFSTIMNRAQWKSIFYLTYCCGEKGLEAAHYRWALVKNHGNLADKPTVKKLEMERFFKNWELDEGFKEFCNPPNDEEERRKYMNKYNDSILNKADRFYFDLEYLYKKQSPLDEFMILKDCISSNSNLSNYLKKMSEDYNILKKQKDDHGIQRYYVTPKFADEYFRYSLHRIIDMFSPRLLQKFANEFSQK